MSARQDKKPVKRGPRCPICREQVEGRYRPFCSKRCADIDLGRWLNGSYAIPGHGDDEEDGMPAPKTDHDPDN
ncbi:MAG: DNA gyrase inhibitor YacG [Methyloligellaceae bacterium]